MINWPHSLVIELAARRCVVFLGAGSSAAATRPETPHQHPPTWPEFLHLLYQSSNRGEEADREKARELLRAEQYLDCAEILKSTCIHPADYDRLLRITFERYR